MVLIEAPRRHGVQTAWVPHFVAGAAIASLFVKDCAINN
jgi:hypothetical protein